MPSGLAMALILKFTKAMEAVAAAVHMKAACGRYLSGSIYTSNFADLISTHR